MSVKSFVRARLATAVRYLSRAYVVGPGLPDALAARSRFARDGRRATLGYFNHADQAAREIADVDLRAIAALADERCDARVALKAPAMRFDAGLIEEIAHAASRAGIGIHFDSHAPDTADRTFAAIESALRFTADVGCTLPGRWRRSIDDAERAADLNLRVRVVKGQWPDPAVPCADMRASCLRLVDRLATRIPAVTVATHDPLLAQRALERLRAAGTPCELELLFGLPMRRASAIANSLGVPVRVYIPFGAAWLPYELAQAVRQPSKLSWVIKDVLTASAWKMLADKPDRHYPTI